MIDKLVPVRVRAEAGERRAVVARGGGIGVENLRQAMRAGVVEAGEADVRHQHCDSCEEQDGERRDEHVEHSHLHVVRFNLLSQVFGSSTDHEAGDEHGNDDEDQHAVEACADPAEDDLAKQDVDHGNDATERHEGVVHGVDRAAACICGGGCKEGGVGDAEADFLTFHIAATLHYGGCRVYVMQKWIAVAFGPVGDKDAGKEKRGHGGEDGPAVARRLDHPAQCYRERAGDYEDGEHLQEVCEGIRILEGGVRCSR